MAQANSAQREPSMEEILASIRRIIEDSDVEKRRDADDAEPTFAAPANDGMERSRDIDAFRAEFHEQPAPSLETEPVSRFHSIDAAGERRDETVVAPSHVDVEARDGSVAGPARATDAAAFDHDSAPQAQTELPRAVFQAPVEAAEITHAGDDMDQGSGEAQSRTPLMSAHTGRQVAAAFGELSEAFAASRRRSFDEMAEEMLRPMLQDWLGNNLPHLVEKLVREEIERIARG